MIHSTRLQVLFAAVAIFAASIGHAASLREVLQRMPGPPSAPSTREECDAFKKPYDDLVKNISDRHSACLAAHSGSGVDSGGGPCSYAACEQYHAVYDQPWYQEVRRAYQQCTEQARMAEAQERERQQELERQQQAYLDAERERTAAQGQWQRDAQQKAYDAAKDQAARDAARLDHKADAANGRAGFFGAAAARNQSLLGSNTGGSNTSAPTSVNAALGGGLSTTLGAIRDLLGSTTSSAPSSRAGSGPDTMAYVPGASNLERASLVSKYLLDWPGTASLLSSAASVVSVAENANDAWSAWSAFRSGDTVGGVGGGAALAADVVLPSYAAFFAVPALKAVTAVNQAALAELDRGFRDFDQVSSSGRSYVSPPPAAEQGPDFHRIQQAYVEAMCDYCRWDDEKGAYKLTIYDDLIEVSADGEISTGWDSIHRVFGDR